MSDVRDPMVRAQARRISYFMLFRLAMLAAFTVLVGVLYTTDRLPALVTEGRYWGAGATRFDSLQGWLVLSTLVAGYSLTIAYARWLPRTTSLRRFAGIQTTFDILLSAVVVHATGGIESGFVSLYLIAVLGAAIMGGRRHTWTAAAACTLVYAVMSSLEIAGVALPFTSQPYARPATAELWNAVGRTLAGLFGVTVLSSYLNTQLASSVSLVGSLRALNENIVRSLNSGLVTLDNDGRLLYFNPAARQILELDDELIGREIDSVFPGMRDAGGGDDTASRFELQLKTRATRRALHVGLNRAPLWDGDGRRVGSVINFQDVTRLHELAQTVRRNERLAALGAMAASVAHEIRNPLAAISGSAELLGTAELGDEDQRLLAVIRRESTRLSGLVDDLLAFTRPRPPEPDLVSLEGPCRQAAEGFAADRANARVEVLLERAPGCEDDELSLYADPAQLSQVLWNLMRNAAEALEGSGRVRLLLHGDDESVGVDVIDAGPGILPEHLESVFDPFFTTKATGTGFGLAIVHRIVEDNGGRISVASTPGAGATFKLSFPRANAHPEEIDARDSGVLDIEPL